LLDVIPDDLQQVDKERFLTQNHLDERPIVALLPGSRKQEIVMALGIMLETCKQFPHIQFVIAAVPSIPPWFYENLIKQFPVSLVYDQTYDLLRCADAAFVTSGTATLETALLGTPQVVCYKGSYLSYLVARMVVHVKFISLVNLVMDKSVVTELIQENFTSKNLAIELTKILPGNINRDTILRDYSGLKEKLGGAGASAKAAGLIVQYLKQNEVK
jgi:lipid-A-disaccharide synthase